MLCGRKLIFKSELKSDRSDVLQNLKDIFKVWYLVHMQGQPTKI